VAFRDIHPKAPTHVLIVPKKHIVSSHHMNQEEAGLMGEMVLMAQQVAEKEGVAQTGYRLVLNTGAGAGQTVFHLHMHVLGGGQLPGF